MTIVVHHLGISQSERILWLLEELELPYELVKHTRDPVLSPESLKSVPGNKTGSSPFIVDTETSVTLSESGAIVEYIIQRYGDARLALTARDDPRVFADYLFWFHYANGSLQPAMISSMFTGHLPDSDRMKGFASQRLEAAFRLVDNRLSENKWLAGNAFTAADIMTVYIVSTQRYFGPRVSLAAYKNILRWLQDCGDRPAYKRAMEKGDPEMQTLLGPEAPKESMFAAGGSKSSHWKKEKL
jgi:glutathione S-transferase